MNGSNDIYLIIFLIYFEMAAQSATKALARKYCTIL
jgi:hypothetical protein